MDALIGFFIPNVPYVWKDRQPSRPGQRGWKTGRFSRTYLVPGAQTLYAENGVQYLSLADDCYAVRTFFQASAARVALNANVRLNGQRVLSKHKTLQTPAQVYRDLNLRFEKISRAAVNRAKAPTWPFRTDCAAVLPKDDKTAKRLSAETVRRMFPPGRADLDYGALWMTNVGEFSITKPFEASQIVGVIKNITWQSLGVDPLSLTMTDATAGVGGDTVSFAINFGKVNAVELDPIHCSVIARNLSVFGLQDRVRIVCTDYLEEIGFFRRAEHVLKQTVVFLDPPWGGRTYRGKTNIVLYLDSIPINKIVRHLLETGQADFVFVKIPRNASLKQFTLPRGGPVPISSPARTMWGEIVPDVSRLRVDNLRTSFSLVWFSSRRLGPPPRFLPRARGWPGGSYYDPRPRGKLFRRAKEKKEKRG